MADGAADIDALAASLEAAKAAHAKLTTEQERVQSERNDHAESLSVSGVLASIDVERVLEAEVEAARSELQRVDAQCLDASERVHWLTARGVVAR